MSDNIMFDRVCHSVALRWSLLLFVIAWSLFVLFAVTVAPLLKSLVKNRYVSKISHRSLCA